MLFPTLSMLFWGDGCPACCMDLFACLCFSDAVADCEIAVAFSDAVADREIVVAFGKMAVQPY